MKEKTKRLALIRDRHQTQASWLDAPENLPESKELPKADISDIVRTYDETVPRQSV